MPRFHFDLSGGPNFLPDEEGFDLDSLDAAEHEATQVLLPLGPDWLPSCRVLRVQVRDEQHQQVLALSLEMKVERLEHLPRLA